MQVLARLALVASIAACGGSQIQERSATDTSKLVPATLDAERPREGDPRSVRVRLWVDAGVRTAPKWREELNDQLDYASQLLTPLIGARLVIDKIERWNREGDAHRALAALAEADAGDGVAWVIGYMSAGDTATKVMDELGSSEPLGRHVVVRAWADKQESEALAGIIPDLKEAERTELLGAHRRHKQTVVLLHHLARTLGAIAEADPAWIQHPAYSPKQHSFSERNRELLGLALDERLADAPALEVAKKLLDSIEKAPWGGWVPADQEAVVTRLRAVLDAAKAGKVAADVPAAAFEAFTRIRELARRGEIKDALAELDNLLAAYPGNASMHQLRCDILLGSEGVAAAATRAACARASELAPGDPSPHVVVAEALAKAGDAKGARAELALAETKIANLPAGADDAWRRVIGAYLAMGALTWTEEAIAKAKLAQDPAAAQVAQTRARYGVPRGTKVVKPEHEAALVEAVRGALDLVYANKYGDADRALAAAEKRWPGAPGLAGARCDLALRTGRIPAARAACAKALAADANASWALYLSGVLALRDAGTTPAGIAQLKRAIAVDPELAQAWRTLAKAYQRTKDQAALDALAKAYLAKFGQPLPP